ncbi:hypothetical protein GCM10028816_48850 [Spirosoma lituiforme]
MNEAINSGKSDNVFINRKYGVNPLVSYYRPKGPVNNKKVGLINDEPDLFVNATRSNQLIVTGLTCP